MHQISMTPNAVGSVSHVAHYNHSSLYLSQIERSRTLRGGQCEAKLITGKRALLRVVCSLSGHSLSWSSSIAILNHNCEWHYNIKLRRTLVFLSRVPLDDARAHHVARRPFHLDSTRRSCSGDDSATGSHPDSHPRDSVCALSGVGIPSLSFIVHVPALYNPRSHMVTV